MKKIRIIIFALSVVGFAQSNDAVVGTWKLISAVDVTDDGRARKEPYGRNPTGLLTYTAEGRMMVIISDGGRKPLTIPGKRMAPVEERAEAFSSSFAYAGRYTVAGGKVIHHVEVSTLENWVNIDLFRLIMKSDNGQLIIRTTVPFTRNGVRIDHEDLAWERSK